MKIDFYILEQGLSQHALLLACKLVEQHAAAQQPIYIHAASQADAERIDALLWTFSDNSFLPHALYEEAETDPPLIQIGYGTPPAQQHLLLNISQDLPAFYQQFPHLIEIVFPEASVQQLARERFRQYREQGHELNTYKLKTHDDYRQSL